jgi:hypothetical protein
MQDAGGDANWIHRDGRFPLPTAFGLLLHCLDF